MEAAGVDAFGEGGGTGVPAGEGGVVKPRGGGGGGEGFEVLGVGRDFVCEEYGRGVEGGERECTRREEQAAH